MWDELDHKEGWVSKNWLFWIVMLEKTLESPLDSKEIKLVNPKGNQPWIFTGRTNAGAETPILWPPDVKDWLIGKDPDAGKDWRQKEKGVAEDEMIGRHHQLNGQQFEETLGESEGQRGLECCSPWVCKELDSQASLSITNSWSLFKLMSIESVTPSNHLILCCPLLLLPSIPASGSFSVSQFYASGGQSIGVSASALKF